MHRSGTSLITRLLRSCGVFMGEKFGINDEAFFFQKINSWVLKQVGGRWDNPEVYKYANEELKNNIISFVRNYIDSYNLIEYLGLKNYVKYKHINQVDFMWGWKDPRTSITLDLWDKIFPNAHIINVYRNPIDVAYSLFIREGKLDKARKTNYSKKVYDPLILKKDGMFQMSPRCHNIDECFCLWKYYVDSIIDFERRSNKKIINIKYEDLLESPKKVFDVVLDDLPDKYMNSVDYKSLEYIDANRKYAFLADDELIKIYNKYRGDETVRKLGYSEII